MNKFRICISIRNDSPIIFDANEESTNAIIESLKINLKDKIITISKVDITNIKLLMLMLNFMAIKNMFGLSLYFQSLHLIDIKIIILY